MQTKMTAIYLLSPMSKGPWGLEVYGYCPNLAQLDPSFPSAQDTVIASKQGWLWFAMSCQRERHRSGVGHGASTVASNLKPYFLFYFEIPSGF